jgi:1-acyl-sn-glycerol-3-phosphate acyltransferase
MFLWPGGVGMRGMWRERISYAWRWLATVWSFALFGLGSLVLALAMFLAQCVSSDTGRTQAMAQRLICRTFRGFVWLLCRLKVIHLRVEGLVEIQQERGCILAANHPTLLDYVLIASLLPRCNCVVKSALWRNAFVRGVVSSAGYIPNSDGASVVSQVRESLDDGNVLVVFPEGSRTVPGCPMKLQRGVANIAVRGPFPVRLVHIHCDPLTLTKGAPWYKIPSRRPCFEIRVGRRVDVCSYMDAVAPSAAARRLTRELTDLLSEGGSNI